jgi:ABC-type sugar transport system ATPase subunit
VFLFDEPLSNLDAKLRGQMRDRDQALQRRWASPRVYVTHDQLEAMTLADRLVVMNGGVVEQIGEPLDIYETFYRSIRYRLPARFKYQRAL